MLGDLPRRPINPPFRISDCVDVILQHDPRPEITLAARLEFLAITGPGQGGGHRQFLLASGTLTACSHSTRVYVTGSSSALRETAYRSRVLLMVLNDRPVQDGVAGHRVDHIERRGQEIITPGFEHGPASVVASHDIQFALYKTPSPRS
jgi:hypothetical protein